MDDSDSQFLQAYIRDGSQLAFTKLVDRHIDLVYATALRVLNGDRHLAQDVAQEVFVRLARHAPLLRDAPRLSGWLYTTTHHTAIKAIRGLARRRQRETEALTMQHSPENDPTTWSQLRPLLDEAMHRLSATDRDAVLLRFFEGKSFSVIGERFGLSENAARMRVERALDKLHGLLRQRGISSTAAALGGLLLQHTAIAAPAGLAATIGAAAITTGATGSATFVVFTFMSSLKVSLGLGVAALAAVGFSVWQNQRLSEAAQTIATLQSERTASARHRAQANSTVPTSQVAAPAVVARDPQRAAQDETARKAKLAMATAKAQIEVTVSNEILQQRLQAFRFTSSLHFAPLYKSLGLSAAQQQDFDQIMEERYWALADVTASALNQGLSRADQSFLDLRQQALNPSESKLRALLGDSGYGAFTEHEATSAGRALASQLNGELSLAGLTLTAEQLTGLSQVFTQHAAEPAPPAQSWMDATLLGYPPAKLTVTTVYWDHVATKLPTFLSPEQTQALNVIYLQAQLTDRANRNAKKQTEALVATRRGT